LERKRNVFLLPNVRESTTKGAKGTARRWLDDEHDDASTTAAHWTTQPEQASAQW